MSWGGQIVFGDAWAAYRGPSGDNSAHAHAALQLCLAIESPVSITDAHGKTTTGRALLVRPGVVHRLQPCAAVLLLLVEPQSPVGALLLRRSEGVDLGPLPFDLEATIPREGPLADCLAALVALARDSERRIDPRVRKAVDALSLPGASVAEAAASVGLSEPRLRALARSQLGVPLSKLLLWRKLGAATRAMTAGGDLASAAAAGGFADQAHFTRTMRNVLGLSPGRAQPGPR
jgi:AraC-like DNA-binding protein